MAGKWELIIVWQKERIVPLQESTWDETEVLDETTDEDTEAEAEVVADMVETEVDLEIEEATPGETVTVDDLEAPFTDPLDDRSAHTERTTDTDKTRIKLSKKIWAELDTMFLNIP